MVGDTRLRDVARAVNSTPKWRLVPMFPYLNVARSKSISSVTFMRYAVTSHVTHRSA
jgi:hypothetical protein